MQTEQIQQALDDYFEVKRFGPDAPFSNWLLPTYREAGIDPSEHLEEAFLLRGNGLMLRASATVEVINTTVFISDETVRKAAELRIPGGQLLCAHHPLDFETSGRGFLPLSVDTLQLAREAGVSIYTMHNPLDVHHETSTNRSIAHALRLSDTEPFYDVGEGMRFGILGRLPTELNIAALAEQVRTISEVGHVNIVSRRPVVSRVGVVAGGGGCDAVRATVDAGCDVLVTGTYRNLVDNEIGARERGELEQILLDLDISLIECSHYASEMVVMKHEFLALCRRLFGLPGTFLPQNDPWH